MVWAFYSSCLRCISSLSRTAALSCLDSMAVSCTLMLAAALAWATICFCYSLSCLFIWVRMCTSYCCLAALACFCWLISTFLWRCETIWFALFLVSSIFFTTWYRIVLVSKLWSTYLAFFHLEQSNSIAQQLEIFFSPLASNFGCHQLPVERRVVVILVWSKVHLVEFLTVVLSVWLLFILIVPTSQFVLAVVLGCHVVLGFHCDF